MDAANTERPSKADQDKLDAAICLVVALLWRRGLSDRVAMIGDVRKGYMVTVVCGKTREVLQQAARKKGVPFEQPSLREVERQTPAPLQAADRAESLPARTCCSPIRERTSGVGFDAAELRGLLIGTARLGGLLTYGEVVRLLGEPWSPKARTALFDALDCVGEENRRRKEPLLAALVVTKATGLPGPGFFRKWLPQAEHDANRRLAHRDCLAAIQGRWGRGSANE